MGFKINLHRAGKKADWEDIAPEERNAWQRTAAQTHGIVTPGNLVTLASFGVGLWALHKYRKGEDMSAAVLFAASLLGDAADGMVADKTSTKSPLGAALDPLKDKLLQVGALSVLTERGTISKEYAAVSLATNATNAAATVAARTRGIHTEASFAGKAKTALEGAYRTQLVPSGLAAYLVGRITETALEDRSVEVPLLGEVNRYVGVASIALSAVVAVDYVRKAMQSVE